MTILETSIADLPREELFLGPRTVQRLADYGVVTVADLTRVGYMDSPPLPEEERMLDKWGHRHEYPIVLCEVRNIGRVRMRRIREFLASHGLQLADEEEIAKYEQRGGIIGT